MNSSQNQLRLRRQDLIPMSATKSNIPLLEAKLLVQLRTLGEPKVEYKIWLESFELIMSELPWLTPVTDFVRNFQF